MGRGVVRWAQQDDVAGRLRTAFSTIEGRAGRRGVARRELSSLLPFMRYTERYIRTVRG